MAGLSAWITRPTAATRRGLSLREVLSPSEPLPHLGTHPDKPPFRVHNEIPGKGVLYASNLPSTPSAEVKEAALDFCVKDTDAPELSIAQRVHLLDQSTDLNSIAYTIATIMAHISPREPILPGTIPHDQRDGGYTSF